MVPFYGVYDWTNRFGQRGKHDGLRRVLERLVVKQRYADAPEVFDQASPMSHVNADAPPALIVHGDLDTLAPVTEARAFVQMLRETSRTPVVYAELHGAHHAFDVFQSIRTLQTVAARRPVPHLAAHRRPSRSDCRARCACRRIGERCVSGGITERSDVHGPYGAIDEPRKGREHGVVVDAPAPEVAPRPIAVGPHGQPCRTEPLVDLVELLTRDRDRVVGRGIVVVLEAEEAGDLPQREIARTDAQRRPAARTRCSAPTSGAQPRRAPRRTR